MYITLYFWVATLGIFLYVFSVDPNVPLFCELYLRKVRAEAMGWIYKAQWDPKTPWGRYNIWRTATRNSEENARLLMKELDIPDE